MCAVRFRNSNYLKAFNTFTRAIYGLLKVNALHGLGRALLLNLDDSLRAWFFNQDDKDVDSKITWR